ncbi:N-acetylglucosamine-6-phosphate deacetylase [Mobilicoccus caccae]|uniref:N-acetylglucosamine-6-phosphate deacetylase n=1 Tax=Mobilicoccus caccae TaxID=1859295 RepID=A0ABQ6IZR8_9MICO|nr:N-acetylglucosamine-6-phosphate deacetylase [Mobilicoccus caccae]GMA42198.1 N-acetylglucosamine-6-phosphate deacetylase [Mobilicoccus caccae]
MLITADAVVTGTEVMRPGWIEVTGGRVAAVGAGVPDRPVDHALGAVTVVPGFVDMHTHGGGGGAFSDATAEATQEAVAFHRRHGTTRIMASLVSAHPGDLLRQVSVLAEHVQDGRILGVHLEGPWMSPNRLGAHDRSTLRNPEPDELVRVFAAADGAIRMVTLAPELPGSLRAVRQIAEAGAVAAVGHTDATYDETRAAIDAGATVATHLFNAMRPIHHREPGPIVALVEDPGVTIEMITDGTHLHPAIYREYARRVGAERVALVTDAMSAAGMCDGRYLLGSLAVEVVEGTARVAGTETIAGSTATMDQLFRFAVTHGGHTGDAALLHAARQTSVNPARTVGAEDAALTPGGRADLVVLDADLQVDRVMTTGRWLDLP